MQTLGSPASVVAAIREDANAEAERIREATVAELASLREATASADVTIDDRDVRLATARRENEERVQRQEWEGRRATIAQREAWLQRVVALAQERFANEPRRLDALIRDAQSRLPEGSREVTVSPSGGCIVTVGKVSFDNTFEARSRRLESEWRSALSRMYAP